MHIIYNFKCFIIVQFLVPYHLVPCVVSQKTVGLVKVPYGETGPLLWACSGNAK